MKNNPLLASISNWFTRTFSDPEAVGLFFTLVFGLLFFEFLGGFFMPVLISIALAYLLLPIVKALDRIKLPHILSVCLVYLFFLGAVIYILLVLFPVLSRQLMTFLNQLPHMVSSSKQWLSVMSQKYPRFISQSQVQQVLSFSELHLSNIGRYLLSFSFSAIPNIVVLVVYIILVPLLLLFFMMDSSKITRWFMQFLPKERGLVDTVFRDINAKIGVYIRGRVIELIVISIVTVMTFLILGLQYPILLGVLVGISVIIPYVGAIVITIPVLTIGLVQWGLSVEFVYLVISYAVIIILDGNVLVPLLFAETMDLHPIVIVLSIIIFGGIWGFWGIFFAIPLASLFNSVLLEWPRPNEVT